MPSGIVHSRTNAVIALGVLVFYRPIETGMLIASGCVLGIFVTPDLDLGETYSFSLIRKYLGRFPYLLWRAYWRIFCVLIPHRHFLSHFPIVSTVFRSLYLFSPLLAVILAFFPDFSTVNWFFWVFVGMVIVDVVHWAMDHISTSLKKLSRSFNVHRVE